jgi:hypothetical protein
MHDDKPKIGLDQLPAPEPAAIREYMRARTPAQKVRVARQKFRERCKASRHGYVYFIQSVIGGPIKIGYAKNPLEKMNQFNLASPFRLRFLAVIDGTMDSERDLHENFKQLRSEWFEADSHLLFFIKGLVPVELPGVVYGKPITEKEK